MTKPKVSRTAQTSAQRSRDIKLNPTTNKRRKPVQTYRRPKSTASILQSPSPASDAEPSIVLEGWDLATDAAELGDIRLICQFLRDPQPDRVPVSPAARVWLANFIEGRKSIPKKPGIKSPIKSKAHQIRFWHDSLTNPKAHQIRIWQDVLTNPIDRTQRAITSGEAIACLAKMHNCSESTIRDVLARRKTFAEKGP